MIDSSALNTVADALGVSPEQVLSDAEATQRMLDACHQLAVQGGWWNDPATGEKLDRNKAEMLCLIHSEISEAMEGERKSLLDDKLPHRPMAEVEMADALIREGDYCGGHGYSVVPAMIEKMAFNLNRADHKRENRLKEGGKSF